MPPTKRELWSVPGPSSHDYFRALYSTVDDSPFDLRFAPGLAEIPDDTSNAVIHANWLWTKAFRTVEGARSFVAGAVAHLDRLLAQGCHLIWSIHEPVSHDRHHLQEEHELNRCLLERASIVHVLTVATPRRCRPDLDVPSDRLLVLVHPLLVHDERVGESSHQTALEIRSVLGVPEGTDVVMALGLRRRYKEFEVAARSVWRRNQNGSSTPCLLVSAGASLGFPTDRTSARTRLLGVATVDAHLPDSLFTGLMSAGSATALPYSSGLNSGVLAGAVSAGTPALISDQLRVPEFEALGPPTFFAADGGHVAIDAALDHALLAPTAQEWAEHRVTFGRTHDPRAISAQFLDAAGELGSEDAPIERSAPSFSNAHLSPSRQHLTATRFIRSERAYAVAMRKVAERARDARDVRAEFDALVGWFESLAYTCESDFGVERLLRLGVELGSEREAISALHRAVDLDSAIAQVVVRSTAGLGDKRRLDVGLADIGSRVGERLTPSPSAEAVAGRLAAFIELQSRRG